MRRGTRVLLVLLATVLLASGCSSSGDAKDDSAPTPRSGDTAPASASDVALDGQVVGEEGYEDVVQPEWVPSTIAEEVALREDTDGLDAQVAVDLFDLAFGEMPGATTSELTEPGPVSTTRALGLVEQFKSDLTPEQRSRVAEVLAQFGPGIPVTPEDASIPLPPEWGSGLSGDSTDGEATPTTMEESPLDPIPGPSSIPVPPTSSPAGPGIRQSFSRSAASSGTVSAAAAEPDAELKKLFTGLVAQIAQGWRTRLGNVGLPNLTLSFSTTPFTTGQGLDAYATASQEDLGCLITFYPSLYDNLGEVGPSYTKFVIAHELFHCVQFEWAPTVYASSPQWVIEGGADFAGLDYYRKQVQPDEFFLAWFAAREAPLSARSYSGAGLWEAVAAEGLDPYASIKLALRASGSTETVLAQAGLNSPRFLLAWPTRTVRTQAYQHPSWTMPWAGLGEGKHENFDKGRAINLGGTNLSGPSNFSHALQAHVFGSGVDVVTVRNKGRHLVSLANDRENIVLGSDEDIVLCVDEARCACPNGNYGGMRFFNSTDVAVGFSASHEAGMVTMLAEKFDKKKHCKPKRPKGSSDGDPHMITMDGIAYELMAAGEFVLASAPDFDVQIRTAPAATAADRYSLITSVAVRLGDDRVTFTVADYLSDPDEVQVRHNGERGDLAGGTMGGWTLTREDSRNWVLTAADGTGIRLKFRNGFFVEVTPPVATAKQMVGLLGSANGDPLDDVRTAQGVEVNANDPDAIHGRFADSWRVTDQTSLFDYGAGESTDTYTDRDYPGDIEKLATTEFREARRRCHQSMGRAATTPEIDACAFDLVASGRDDYVEAYTELVEQRSDSPSVADEAPPDRPTTTRSGGAEPTTGRPALRLKGKLAPISDPSPPADSELTLRGDVQVPAGSVITLVLECPAGVDYSANIGGPGGGSAVVGLCGDSTPLLDDNDSPHSGEAYVWVPDAGTYEVVLEDNSVAGRTRVVDMAVFVDADPQVDDLTASWRGELSGLGDVATLPIEGGADYETVTLESSSASNLCVTVIQVVDDEVAVPIPTCDSPDETVAAAVGGGTDALLIVHSRDASGGAFRFDRKGT